MKAIHLILLFLLASCAGPARRLSSEERMPWVRRGGIELANLSGELVVVRADPRANALELVNPPESAGGLAHAAARSRFAAAINAAMFAQDYVTSIGYMRNFGRINNNHVSSRLRGWLLFHPRKAGLPLVKIGTWEEAEGYDTAFQTYRMWTPSEGILWKRGSVFQQVALAGTDEKGRILFFFHPGFLDVYDLVAKILDLDLGLTGLLYLDGGHHGGLYLEPELGDSWNSDIVLPNLLGIKAAP